MDRSSPIRRTDNHSNLFPRTFIISLLDSRTRRSPSVSPIHHCPWRSRFFQLPPHHTGVWTPFLNHQIPQILSKIPPPPRPLNGSSFYIRFETNSARTELRSDDNPTYTPTVSVYRSQLRHILLAELPVSTFQPVP